MAFPAQFSDLYGLVLAKARMDPNASADVTKAKDAVNLAYQQAVVENEALEASGTLALTAGTATYDLTTVATGAVLRVKAVTVTSGGVVSAPLPQVSLDDILRRRQSSGGVSVATGSVERYALVGYKDLELYPTPGSSSDTLTFYYLAGPTKLTGDSDVPIIPEPYASKLLQYGALVEVGDFKGDPRTDAWQQMYDVWLAKYRLHLTLRRGSGSPGQFEFVPDRAYPPHDPSVDRGY